jgi:hypothetical protein
MTDLHHVVTRLVFAGEIAIVAAAGVAMLVGFFTVYRHHKL